MRTISEIKLLWISVVLVPVNPDCTFKVIK